MNWGFNPNPRQFQPAPRAKTEINAGMTRGPVLHRRQGNSHGSRQCLDAHCRRVLL